MAKVKVVDLLKKLNRLASAKQVYALEFKAYETEEDTIKISSLIVELNKDPSNIQLQQNLQNGFTELDQKCSHIEEYETLKKTYLFVSKLFSELLVFLNNDELKKSVNWWDIEVDFEDQLLADINEFINNNFPEGHYNRPTYRGINGVYDAFMEFVVTERSFIDECNKINVELIQEMLEKDYDSQIDDKILKDINQLHIIKELTNHFEFNYSRALSHAQDISQFFCSMYTVFAKTEFSEFYKTKLGNLAKNYQGLLDTLVALKMRHQQKGKYDESLTPQQIEALEYALMYCIPAPMQRITRHNLLIQEFYKHYEKIDKKIEFAFSYRLMFDGMAEAFQKSAKRRVENANVGMDRKNIPIKKIKREDGAQVTLAKQVQDLIDECWSIINLADGSKEHIAQLVSGDRLADFEKELTLLCKIFEKNIYNHYWKFCIAGFTSLSEETFTPPTDIQKQITDTKNLVELIYNPRATIADKNDAIQEYKRTYGASMPLLAKQKAVIALCVVATTLVFAIGGALLGMTLSPAGSIAGALTGAAIGVKAGLMIGGIAAGTAAVAGTASGLTATVCFWKSNKNARNPVNKQMSKLADSAHKLVKEQKKEDVMVMA